MRFLWPRRSISRIEVSSSSQTAETRSQEVKKFCRKLAVYSVSERDSSQASTLAGGLANAETGSNGKMKLSYNECMLEMKMIEDFNLVLA